MHPLRDHAFADPALRQQALTHRSAGSPHNERLEFLGDAILSLVIAEALFERLPDANEGDLTRLRAHLVRGETLAELAADMGLADQVILGPGELKSGSWRRASILADAVEAMIGAIARDAGYHAARAAVLAAYAARLDALPCADTLKDPKTRLQEFLQAQAADRPAYTVVQQSGPDHARHFIVRCELPDCPPVQAEGSSRRKAEQAAAERMLAQLQA